MRILVTSGGTKVPLDPVRNITNNSTGTFGANIAKAGLMANAEVIYLISKEGRSPFALSFDYAQSADLHHDQRQLEALYAFAQRYRKYYTEYRYTNFTEYAQLLEKIVKEQTPDVVILAAAVSDYLIENYAVEKIRSGEHLRLQLEPAPKLIRFIKQWLPQTFLVGFKLLIDAPETQLVEAAMQSIAANGADIIVANNLVSLQKGAHEILLVEQDGAYQKVTCHLAETLIDWIIKRKGHSSHLP